ncbi:MAG: PstS family phosphate ABC transporter substrate-binding protein [Actinobacteria bacterium]|nr:PstS family phosphate ABC transporter substrate-binding protein [Actinomycetota bacterium]
MVSRKKLVGSIFILILMLLAFSSGCRKTKDNNSKESSGEVRADGSSTVYPITEAVAEEFQKENPDVRVTVGTSGTGGGFKKFVAGEIDINDASRPIKDEEKQKAEENKIEYVDFKVAFDGITIAVNPENDWAKDITVDELKKTWEPESKVTKWSDIRTNWPDEKIILFGPDTDSGTFDFFTEKIVGEEGSSRSEYTASADDNVLVEGVSGEKYSLGYFGYAYYKENKDKLKFLKVNGVAPGVDTILKGTYQPLSRPVFIYVNKESLKREELSAFVKFYLENASSLVKDVGYIPVPESDYQEQLEKLEELIKE